MDIVNNLSDNDYIVIAGSAISAYIAGYAEEDLHNRSRYTTELIGGGGDSKKIVALGSLAAAGYGGYRAVQAGETLFKVGALAAVSMIVAGFLGKKVDDRKYGN